MLWVAIVEDLVKSLLDEETQRCPVDGLWLDAFTMGMRQERRQNLSDTSLPGPQSQSLAVYHDNFSRCTEPEPDSRIGIQSLCAAQFF